MNFAFGRHYPARVYFFMVISGNLNVIINLMISVWLLSLMVWMFHGRTLKNKINHSHERVLQIIYRNCWNCSYCSYKDFYKMDQSFTVHQRNIQSLAIELFKVKQNSSTHMMNNIFQMRDDLRYNLRSQTKFLRSSANKSQYGLNSEEFLVQKYWIWYQLILKTAQLWIFSREK